LARQFHQRTDVVSQQNPGTHSSKSHRRALVNFYFEPIGSESHDAGRFDPWNLLQLRFPLPKGHEENVAADVAAHDFHHLRARNVLQTADFNVVARLDAEAPGTLAIVVDRGDGHSTDEDDRENDGGPGQARHSFFGKGTATNGYALLHP